MFSPAEKLEISTALKLSKPWDYESQTITVVKNKLRSYHLKAQKNKCCYCRMILNASNPFVVDREHILPKTYFPQFSYEVDNISVACKRCNMSIKKTKRDFIIWNHHTCLIGPLSINFKFIHPNIDKFSDYISVEVRQIDDSSFILYRIINSCEKSRYHYEYFDFESIMASGFNIVQGVFEDQSISDLIVEFQNLQ